MVLYNDIGKRVAGVVPEKAGVVVEFNFIISYYFCLVLVSIKPLCSNNRRYVKYRIFAKLAISIF